MLQPRQHQFWRRYYWKSDILFWSKLNNNFGLSCSYLGQSIQEWTKRNLWKTAFKKFEVQISLQILESFFSCIDNIFKTQSNLVVESGVHPSLHQNYHHQIVSASFNLQIYYPSPYPREMGHYKQTNTELIRQATTDFNWDRAFLNTNVNKKFLSSATLLWITEATLFLKRE